MSGQIEYSNTIIGKGTIIDPSVILGYPSRNYIRNGEKPKGTTVIGPNCVFLSGCIIYADVLIGKNVLTGHNCLIREGVCVGDGSKLGSFVYLGPGVSVGKNCLIENNVFLPQGTRIEDNCFIGPSVTFTNDKYVHRKKTKLIGAHVCKGASIGAGAVILPGIRIGCGAVVGAGSVVTKNVAPRMIVMGNPAGNYKSVPRDWTFSSKG